MKRVYLDNAATTPVCEAAIRAMQEAAKNVYGNASGVYSTARTARACLERARQTVAELIGADAREIYFTSGGTESDNWALKGAAYRAQSGHIITSAIEHPAVLRTCDFLEKLGFSVTRLPVDAYGTVDPDDVTRAIRKDTILISVMTANNEIGTVEPVRQIGALARAAGIPFHTDAVQAAGILPINVHAYQVDMLSLSAHKFHGPKGVGVLYVRNGIRLESLLHGGEQERGKRASTENVPGVAGMAAALSFSCSSAADAAKGMASLRDKLLRKLLEALPDIVVNGHQESRLPGNLHICIPQVKDESLIPLLDLNGVEASSGSACMAGSYLPSHVLKAIGREEHLIPGALRLTLSCFTTEEEIDLAADRIISTVHQLRKG